MSICWIHITADAVVQMFQTDLFSPVASPGGAQRLASKVKIAQAGRQGMLPLAFLLHEQFKL